MSPRPARTAIHLYPEQDIMEHAASAEQCFCHPHTEILVNEDTNAVEWVYIHHALEDRDHRELMHLINTVHDNRIEPIINDGMPLHLEISAPDDLRGLYNGGFAN